MGRGITVIINGKSFPSKASAKKHFMDQRERVKADGPLKSGELYRPASGACAEGSQDHRLQC